MNKVSWIVGMTISIAAIFLTHSITNVAKAYNCGSASSTHGGSLSTSVTGTTGSCATSSGSSVSAKSSIADAKGPNTAYKAIAGNGQGQGEGGLAYSGAGGSTSSCSSSAADHRVVASFSVSQPRPHNCS